MQLEGRKGKVKTLHRNLLLPLGQLFDPPRINEDDSPKHDGIIPEAESPLELETEVDHTSPPLTQATRHEISSFEALLSESVSYSPLESDSKSGNKRQRTQRHKRQPLWMRQGNFKIIKWFLCQQIGHNGNRKLLSC